MRFIALVLAIMFLATSTLAQTADNENLPAGIIKKDDKKKEEKKGPPPLDPKEVLKIEPTDKILGNASAPVTIFEYSSLSCPHCAHFHNEVLPKLDEKYISSGKVKLINRDFPLNEPALRAATIAHCDDAKYYTYLKVFYKTQGDWAYNPNFLNIIKNIAKLGGMNSDKLEACLKDKKLEKLIVDTRLRAERIGVGATPSFFINGKLYEDSRDVPGFSKAIDKALKETAK